MEHTQLDKKDIENRLPHRFENLLLDACTISEPGHGEGMLHITPNDELERSIFTWHPTQNTVALLPSVPMEVLALLAIVSTGEIKEGENAFFAAISNYKNTGFIDASKPIKSVCKKASDKGGFLMYKGEVKTKTGQCSGDVLAFYADKNITASGDAKKVDPPKLTENKEVKAPTSKDNRMFLCDKITHDTDNVFTTEYTYPTQHPLTKGHFPDRAIMMGVMQWMMAEDAVYALIQSKTLTGHNTIQANATITKKDGTLVCEMKRLICETWYKTADRNDGVITSSAKRIAFRSMVEPGDTLYLTLSYTVNK